MPLVVRGSSAILVNGTGLSSKQLLMLRSDYSTIMFIRYVTFARKEASFPEPVCSNSCCGRFKVSFPNQPSNLIVCNNSGWFFSQISFCVVYLQRLHEGKVQRLHFMSAMRGRQTMCTPYSRAQSVISILLEWKQRPSSVRITGSFLDGFTKRRKMFEPLHKGLFLDPSSLVTSCYWTWWSAIKEFSLHVVPRKTPEDEEHT